MGWKVKDLGGSNKMSDVLGGVMGDESKGGGGCMSDV